MRNYIQYKDLLIAKREGKAYFLILDYNKEWELFGYMAEFMDCPNLWICQATTQEEAEESIKEWINWLDGSAHA